MTQEMDAIDRGMLVLKERFHASLPGRIEELKVGIDSLSDATTDKSTCLAEIVRKAHSLKGTAATFKEEDLAATAAEIEGEAAAMARGDVSPSGPADLRSLINKLEALVGG